MAEVKKYVVVASEVYEMLLIKAETPVNSSTTKHRRSMLEFLKKKNIDCMQKS